MSQDSMGIFEYQYWWHGKWDRKYIALQFNGAPFTTSVSWMQAEYIYKTSDENGVKIQVERMTHKAKREPMIPN